MNDETHDLDDLTEILDVHYDQLVKIAERLGVDLRPWAKPSIADLPFRVSAHSEIIKGLASAIEQQRDATGLAAEITADLQAAASATPSALELGFHQIEAILVPDLAPDLAAIITAQGRTIDKLDDASYP